MGYDQVRNSRRKLMAAMLSPLLFGGCKFSRYFDVEWDDEVELFGDCVSINELAQSAGHIPYEILCHIKRMRRIYQA